MFQYNKLKCFRVKPLKHCFRSCKFVPFERVCFVSFTKAPSITYLNSYAASLSILKTPLNVPFFNLFKVPSFGFQLLKSPITATSSASLRLLKSNFTNGFCLYKLLLNSHNAFILMFYNKGNKNY
jgi:hypothetical protein